MIETTEEFENRLGALDPEDVAFIVHTDELIEDLRSAGKEAFSIEGADAIVEHLTPQLRPDDVVVVMSNGGFGGIHQKLLDALEFSYNPTS